jgi:hypothetical protein
MPMHLVSATTVVSSSFATCGVPPQPGVGQVCPQPTSRVAWLIDGENRATSYGV